MRLHDRPWQDDQHDELGEDDEHDELGGQGHNMLQVRSLCCMEPSLVPVYNIRKVLLEPQR